MHVSNYVMSIVSVLLLCPLVYSNDDVYSNEWLLEADITDDEARNLATAHGLSFVKRVDIIVSTFLLACNTWTNMIPRRVVKFETVIISFNNVQHVLCVYAPDIV